MTGFLPLPLTLPPLPPAPLLPPPSPLQGVTGFLRKSVHEAVFGAGSGLQVGSLVEVVVLDKRDKRNVQVSTDPQQVGP